MAIDLLGLMGTIADKGIEFERWKIGYRIEYL